MMMNPSMHQQTEQIIVIAKVKLFPLVKYQLNTKIKQDYKIFACT